MAHPSRFDRPDVALICRDLGIGGVERIWVNLANGFARQGFRVDLILLNARGAYLASLHERVRVVNFGTQTSRLQKILTLSLQSVGSLLKLVGYLQRERPRALLAATHYINEIAILAKLLARVETRVVVSEHVNVSQEIGQGVRASNRFIPLTTRVMHPLADWIVAVSHGVANDLRRYGLERRTIEVIYNPIIDDDLYQRAAAVAEFPWKPDPNYPIVFSCGRFVPHKNFDAIVRAFAKVVRDRPARLVLLGDGVERPKVRQLVAKLGLENCVWMPGFVENVYAYMKRADLFAFASSNEGFGNVLVEAMALGLPVVSTDCPSGPSEVLDRGRYGKLVPVGDIEAMADAIAATLADPPAPTPKAWLDRFTIRTVTNQYAKAVGIARERSSRGVL
ncbi:MAG: glycosyltransferase [Geitlerinemataceae cyanobacterium]